MLLCLHFRQSVRPLVLINSTYAFKSCRWPIIPCPRESLRKGFSDSLLTTFKWCPCHHRHPQINEYPGGRSVFAVLTSEIGKGTRSPSQ